MQWRNDAGWIVDAHAGTDPHTLQFSGDLTGEPLDAVEVCKARKLEIEYFQQMGVYRKVPMHTGKAGNHRVLGARRVDVKKVDRTHRSWLVAKEIKTYNAPELFVAMPLRKSLKYVLRRAAQGENDYVMHVDVTRAYVYADASREIYAKLPGEDTEPGDEEMCGRLVQAMSGTRDATHNWQRTSSETDREVGFVGEGVPVPPLSERVARVRDRARRRVCFASSKEHLQHIARHLETKLKIKVMIIGPDAPSELLVLSRSIKWADQGIQYERDHRCADRAIEELRRCGSRGKDAIRMTRPKSQRRQRRSWCEDTPRPSTGQAEADRWAVHNEHGAGGQCDWRGDLHSGQYRANRSGPMRGSAANVGR